MFRLEAFVEDKKLHKAMIALDGLVVQLTAVPVRNAIVKNGKVAGAGGPTTGREVVVAVMQAATAAGNAEITRKEIISAAGQYGVSDTAVKTAINTIIKEGVLRRKARGIFKVGKHQGGM